jgi:hypothetical protein
MTLPWSFFLAVFVLSVSRDKNRAIAYRFCRNANKTIRHMNCDGDAQ